ncbi:MAG TPA: O-antigen ligase family protein [Prosthecobacter sp.]|nr:O-antigen ligase family protein [Prosthecobacter sp.]
MRASQQLRLQGAGITQPSHELQLFKTLALFLMLPSFLEAIDSRFLISIPWSPLSLGRLCFVGCGFIGILTADRTILSTKTARGIILIGLGATIGSVFAQSMEEGVSKGLGFLVLCFGAVGFGFILHETRARRALDLFFVVLIAYWYLYVANLAFRSGFGSYGEMFMGGRGDVLNHHIPGMYISVSSCFIGVRYFMKEGHLSIIGYLIIILGIISCMYIESRSNFLAMSISLIVIMFSQKRSRKMALLLVPVIAFVYYILNIVASNQEAIAQRFDIYDRDYQMRTSESRFWLMKAALQAFIANPFGMGFDDIKLGFMGGRYLVHNQYITFTLAGGVLAVVGTFVWLKEAFVVLRKMLFGWRFERRPESVAIAMALLVFMVTLLTIEWTDLLFFILISMLVYLSGRFYDLQSEWAEAPLGAQRGGTRFENR